MGKKYNYIYSFIIFLISFFIFFSNASAKSEEWRYDINDLQIDSENNLIVYGWATIKYDESGNLASTGKYSGAKDGETYLTDNPIYYLRLASYHEDGSVSYYPNENGWQYQNSGVTGFSVTCPLYYVTGGSCFTAMESGGFDKRNSLENIYFHDNTDFRFEHSISDLPSEIDYSLEMKINSSNWKTVHVYKNESNKVGNFTIYAAKQAIMLGKIATKQNANISWNSSNRLDGSEFVNGKTYNIVNQKSEDKSRSTSTGAYYRYFQLQNPDPGKSSDTAWAYSAWVELVGDTSTTIVKEDPCDDLKYSIENPSVCCNTASPKYPETCCGSSSYVNSSNFNVTTNWQNQICCSNEEKYDIDGENEYKTFKYYLNHPSESSPGNFITNDFINSKCSNPLIATTSPKVCNSDSKEIGKTYTISYFKVKTDDSGNFVDFNENNNEYTIPIELDEAPKKSLKQEDLAYSYFYGISDYNNYISQKNNPIISTDNLFVKNEYSKYALENNAFTYNISLIQETSTKYLLKVNATLNPGYTPTKAPITNSILGKRVLGDNEGVYFIPIKIWLCDEEEEEEEEEGDCKDPSYFSANKAYCCTTTPYKHDSLKCPSDTTPEYGWGNTSRLSCSGNQKVYTQSQTKYKNSLCTITCNNTITLDNYNTIDDMKVIKTVSGGGFEYNMDVNNNVSCRIGYSTSTTFSSYENAKSAITSCKNEYNKYIKSYSEYKNDVINKQTIKFRPQGDSSINYEYAYINSPNNHSTTRNVKVKYGVDTDGDGINDETRYIDELMNSNVNIDYKYGIRLPRTYISKLTSETTRVSNSSYTSYDTNDYYNAGYKYYTKIETITGVYNFSVYFDKMGIGDKKVNGKSFTCKYSAIDQIKSSKNECIIKKNCSNPPPPDSVDPNYYFRVISLLYPFPNRTPGPNWYGTSSNRLQKSYNYITKKSDSVYGEEPMYSIKLTPSLITEIRNYNKERNAYGGYTDLTTMKTTNNNSTSSYLDYLKIKHGLKIRSNINRKEKIGDF